MPTRRPHPLLAPSLILILACAHPPAQLDSFQADSGRVVVPGSSLYYERAGTGPVIVLLHAGYLDRRMWDPQFRDLAQNNLVIRYDARGLGRSGPARSPYSQSDDLFQLLRSLHISRATLIGCSLGGGTALDFAVTHPEKVERLVLVAPGLSGYVWPPDDLQEPWRVTARAALARQDTVGVARAWLHSAYLQPASELPGPAALLDQMLGENVSYWKGLLHDRQTWDTDPSPPAIARLESVAVPVLLIVGTRDVPDIEHIIDTLRVKLPRATTVTIPGAGHIVNLENPTAFRAALWPFLTASPEVKAH